MTGCDETKKQDICFENVFFERPITVGARCDFALKYVIATLESQKRQLHVFRVCGGQMDAKIKTRKVYSFCVCGQKTLENFGGVR